MEYHVLCCDENGDSLEIKNHNGTWYSFYLCIKPKFGDCFVFCGKHFIVEEMLADYSKVFLREEKSDAENKENKGSMPVFA